MRLAGIAPELRARGKLLYNLLIQTVSGRALNILRLLPAGEGFIAWKRLVAEYEPSSMSRHLLMLVGVLTPEWGERAGFVDELLKWEKRVSD